MSRLNIGFIGAGNMAGAIIGGIVAKDLLKPQQIGVFDISDARLEECRGKGLVPFADIPSLVKDCGYIVLSVKPQQFPEVLPKVKEQMTPDKVIISIAAGITAKTIQDGVGFPCKVVLVNPNTPLMLGCGATALCRVEPCTVEEFAFVQNIFASAGMAVQIAQDKLNEIIPVNGSSPAFIYQFAKVIVNKAQQQGIDPELANRLFCQTLIGAAQMMLQTGKSHQELIDMVCSPGGTTLAALKAMEENGFSKALESGYDACVARAKELAGDK